MNFSAAWTAMLAGKRLTRTKWAGWQQYVRILAIRCYEPCVVQTTESGTERPGWCPSTEDLFAEDWQVWT